MWKKIKGLLKYLLDSDEKKFRKDLKKILGFFPINLEYYKTAFIHKSASYTDHTGKVVNNERLEFLGDAILDAVIGDFLFNKYPNADEGFLTKARAKLVNRAILTHLAHKLNLDQFIITHIKHYIINKHIPGNALEAFIGAIYIDVGYEATKKFIEKRLFGKYVDIIKVIKSDNNYKSRIIEWAQQNHHTINFETQQIDSNIPIHFRAKVFVNDQFMGEGIGTSKKEAEQNAAKKAIEKISDKLEHNELEK